MLRKRIVWVLSLTLFIQMYTNDAVAQKNSFNQASIFIKAEHLFSNLLTKDHFRLSLSGRSIIDGKVRLSISTHDYRQIFTDSFPATDLLWDYAEADIGINQKEAIIRKRMEDFFSDNITIHRYNYLTLALLFFH